MGFERRVVLYEGTDMDKAIEARTLLSEAKVEFGLGFGNSSRFQASEFPIVSESMTDYYGIEAISRHFKQ